MNLGMCRALFYTAVFVLLGQDNYAAWASVSPAFWDPIWPFSVLGIGVPWSPACAYVLDFVWKLTLAFSAIGLFTRLNTVGAFVLGAYFLGLPHNFGKIHHYDAYIVLMLGILALSRCGDAWSIDSLRRRQVGKEPPLERREGIGTYTWPIRMIWIVLACVLFAAGLAKLRYSGLAWIVSENMARLLVLHAYVISNADPLTYWGPSLAVKRGIPQLIAASTVIIELAFPLALVSRVARWILVPSSALMVLGIRVLMGPSFETLAVCTLFWVPWDPTVVRVSTRVRAKLLAAVGRTMGLTRHRRRRT
jgi:hypothetical protein